MVPKSNSPKLVFLRGLARSQFHWHDFPQHIQDKLGVNVQMIDLPGAGLKCHLKSPVRVSEIADQVAEEIQEEKVFLVGLSLGGMVAMEVAARYPQKVASLILINTSVGSLSPFYRRLHLKSVIKKIGLTQVTPYQRERFIFRLQSNQKESPEVIQKWVEIQKQHPVSLGNFARQLKAAATYLPNWELLKAHSVLLVNSLGDQLVSPKCTEEIHQKTKWPCEVHPTAGHALELDDPQWLEQVIKKWVFSKS